MKTSIDRKRSHLIERLRQFDSLAIALSGGVDSALLLCEAQYALGERLIAITARSPIHSDQDREDARRLCADLHVSHLIVDTNEMDHPDFTANTRERCYVCKRVLFGQLQNRLRDAGVTHMAHGANVDDLNDYRPGLRAARELGVVAPLIDADLKKEEIRSLAREHGLEAWDKPAMACFATRIPYQTPITRQSIEQIKAAETMLGKAGLSGCRVRHHGDVARIEVHPEQLIRLVSEPLRSRLVDNLRRIGFDHVCVDLEGYKKGSLNRVLSTTKNSND